MISLCVFSKNRPMQLDAFLKSLKNAPYMTDIYVFYIADDNKFYKGYDILKQEYTNVNFVLETDFYSQTVELVKNFNEYFTWATDDSIFFKPSSLTQDKLDWVFKEQKCMALNLRMGLNIKWQNHWHSEASKPINVKAQYKDIIVWNASDYNVNTDVGRVWQNDASIMPRDLYLKHLLTETRWKVNKSRSLDGLAQSGRVYNPCYMASFENNVYVNIPVNLVHLLDNGLLYADNWGKYHQHDIHALNDLFLVGNRINVDEINMDNLDCGRKEVQYSFMEQ